MIDLALVLVNWARERLEHLEDWLQKKKYPLLEVEPSEISKAFVKAYEAPVKEMFEQMHSRLKAKGDFRERR